MTLIGCSVAFGDRKGAGRMAVPFDVSIEGNRAQNALLR